MLEVVHDKRKENVLLFFIDMLNAPLYNEVNNTL